MDRPPLKYSVLDSKCMANTAHIFAAEHTLEKTVYMKSKRGKVGILVGSMLITDTQLAKHS